MVTDGATAMPEAVDAPPARALTPAEARAMFDAELHEVLGPDWTPERFRAAIDAGEFTEDDDERIVGLWMMLPFAG